MHTENLKTYAPMPKEEKRIANNPMKLYTYLVCISGLATYPDNTRIFQQKDLVLTHIEEAIGITAKTVKLYLYYLERDGLIKYGGNHHFRLHLDSDFDLTAKSEKAAYRKAAEKHSAEIWKLRNKEEKKCYYYIPRPSPFTKIPEETIQKLNEQFEATEQELKIYYLCCSYRDLCCYHKQQYKSICFESLRDLFKLSKNTYNDGTIRKSLTFLKGLGLINFYETQTLNSKKQPIPCFHLTDVNYYINYNVIVNKNENTIEDEILLEAFHRIRDVVDKIED